MHKLFRAVELHDEGGVVGLYRPDVEFLGRNTVRYSPAFSNGEVPYAMFG